MSTAHRTFQLGGTDYDYVGSVPDHNGQTIKRFTYGQEPQVIALVPLADGGSVEVHGYATFWSQLEVEVAWTDDRGSEYSCWVPAGRFDGRRPANGGAITSRAKRVLFQETIGGPGGRRWFRLSGP